MHVKCTLEVLAKCKANGDISTYNRVKQDQIDNGWMTVEELKSKSSKKSSLKQSQSNSNSQKTTA